MKRLWLLLLPLMVTACQAQTADKEVKKDTEPALDNKPKVEVKVNKVYDKNGNVISYDSTYVWSYTNTTGDSTSVDVDSLMSQFGPFMQNHSQLTFPGFDNDWMLNDTMFYDRFLGPDYFMNRWQSEMERMEQMIRGMDSLREQFLNEHYPGLMYDKPGEKK